MTVDGARNAVYNPQRKAVGNAAGTFMKDAITLLFKKNC